MSESPFEHSTLQSQALNTPAPSNSTIGSTPASGQGIEIRYPKVQRTFIPAVMLLTAFIAPAVVFFFVQPPLNLVIAVMIAAMELSTAAFMWFIYNSYFVRLDESGITKSQMGQTKTVRWEEVRGFEMQESALSRPARRKYVLKDSAGNELVEFIDFSDGEQSARLLDYVTEKMEPNS